MKRLLIYILLIFLPLVVGFIYYTYYGESGDEWSNQCSFHTVTGMHCPGCGGQRAFHALLHGQILDAMRYNALLIFILPFFLYIYFLLAQVYILKNKKYLQKFNFSPNFGYVFLAILILFFILRNIPVTPFIYLAPPQ